MTTFQFTPGMAVRSRGERFTVVDVIPLATGQAAISKITLRGIEGELTGQEVTVLHPIEEIEPDELPELSLERAGRLARFRLLHDVFRLRAAPTTDMLVGIKRARIRVEPYQYVPVLRALELPRPRLLLADDVGLGKTIEAGLILRDLAARRRATRVLIVCPAGIMDQWREELEGKFGFQFEVFDQDVIHETRLKNEIGTNPWAVTPRVIASMDLIKRREGAFRELSATKWDVVIVDEAHHLSGGRTDDDVTDRHRLGRWLADATDALLLLTATPHNGYDESFSSLLALLEPSLLMPDGRIQYLMYKRHLIRRLKKHIHNEDGSQKFRLRRVDPIPVRLNEPEQKLHSAVMAQAKDLEEFADSLSRQSDAEAVRLVATILRKRAASSSSALSHTIDQRRNNLSERIEDLELQRDHLRAMRRGDAVPDAALSRLEKDAHMNYLSVVRRLGQRIRRAGTEEEALSRLQELLEDCAQLPESKMSRLLETLRSIHSEDPEDKVIVFSEYADTVEAIVASLDNEPDFHGRLCQLSGELSQEQRKAVLSEFASPRKLLLIATDVAGEGLNLQEHCHRMIHFELPWNPNRLEQRNGRIDRYGQQHEPIIGFLYAEQTYEGRVLAILVEKIERQIGKLGSVGDTLGQIQLDRIEEIMRRCPENIDKATAEAERDIQAEIDRANNASLPQLLGDGGLDTEEVLKADQAAKTGSAACVDLVEFLERAIRATGEGRLERINGRISVDTPSKWFSASVSAHYSDLTVLGPESIDEVPLAKLLHDSHPIVEAAVRWIKASRFAREDDHRLAYVVTSALNEPDLIATFLLRLQDGVGHIQERLVAVRINEGREISQEDLEDIAAIDAVSESNVGIPALIDMFGNWWQEAVNKTAEEATRRASSWRHAVISMRNLTQAQLLHELDEWHRESRQAIVGVQQRQLSMFDQSRLPPAVRRKLNQHHERYRQRREYLERRVQFADTIVEPIGVLLRVPRARLEDSRTT